MIRPDDNFDAQKGEDGLKIWDIQTRKEIPISQQTFQERSHVSCVCWATRRNESVDVVCYGNELGFLVFFQYRPSEVSNRTSRFSNQSLNPISRVDSNPYSPPASLGDKKFCASQPTIATALRSG